MPPTRTPGATATSAGSITATNPVVSAYSKIAQIIDLLPNNIIETFIRARAPRNPHDRIPLEQVNLSYTLYARQLAGEFEDILVWFKADTRSLRVENKFDFIGDLNRKERLQAHWEYLTNQIDQLGGVDRAAFSFLPRGPQTGPQGQAHQRARGRAPQRHAT